MNSFITTIIDDILILENRVYYLVA